MESYKKISYIENKFAEYQAENLAKIIKKVTLKISFWDFWTSSM